jgi:cytochrome P450
VFSPAALPPCPHASSIAAAVSPWGFGIRACIGSQFALWEAKLFLAVILRCFK